MMKKRVPVSSIMTKNLVTANVSDSLRHVSTLLKEHQIRHLPIVSGNKLVGIVSKTDIMRLSFGDMFDGQGSADEAIFDMLKLEQVMVSNPTTVQEDDNIRDVAEKFAQVEFHAMPVLNGDQITGIVSTTDLIKYLLEQYN
jgi:CBS domain-containing protein